MPPWAYWVLPSERPFLVRTSTDPWETASRAKERPAIPPPRTRKSTCSLGSRLIWDDYLYHAGTTGDKVVWGAPPYHPAPEPMLRTAAALALAGTLVAPVRARAGHVYSYVDQDGVIRVFDETSDEYARLHKRAPRARGRIVSTPQVHRIEINERIPPDQAQ